MHLKTLLGIAGVNDEENVRALRLGRFFDQAIVLAIFLIFLDLVLSLTNQKTNFLEQWLGVIIWLIFLSEVLTLSLVVDQRRRYLQENWLTLLVVIFTIPWIEWGSFWPLIIRLLRFVVVFRFLSQSLAAAHKILTTNGFGKILLLAALLIFMAGALLSYIEPEKSLLDGLWWALVTISTVGYGDVAPQTLAGRILGAAVILIGVVVFSIVTANIAAFLIGSEQEDREAEILAHVKRLSMMQIDESDQTQAQLSEFMQKMDSHMASLQGQIQDLQQQLHSQQTQQESAKDEQPPL